MSRGVSSSAAFVDSGDAAGVRMYYLEGEIELMSPSRGHESNKKTLARLLELWALETDTPSSTSS